MLLGEHSFFSYHVCMSVWVSHAPPVFIGCHFDREQKSATGVYITLDPSFFLLFLDHPYHYF